RSMRHAAALRCEAGRHCHSRRFTATPPRVSTSVMCGGRCVSETGIRRGDMCVGIALAVSEFPLSLLNQPRVQARLHSRGGGAEVRFLYRDPDRLLPIIHGGELRLVRWGSRRKESKVLPPTGWTWLASVEGGQWGQASTESIVIPATMGYEKGIW